MGCDIHLYVEQRKNGEWLAADTFVVEDEYRTTVSPSYSGRNYNLFAMLADVRNGRGFAGVKTGNGFAPIAEPRGVPDDASVEYKSQVAQWEGDGHSHSHHTLRQLLDYDWTQTTTLSGWCNALEWMKWSLYKRGEGHGPDSYSGSVSGGSVKHTTAAEMDALLAPAAKASYQEREALAEQFLHTYAHAEWSEPYYRAAGGFLSETIPRLLKLAGGVDGADDVRIVFFFDN
jgi:hypothetical protein